MKEMIIADWAGVLGFLVPLRQPQKEVVVAEAEVEGLAVIFIGAEHRIILASRHLQHT